MADPNDVAASKRLRSELGKKFIDVSQADVRVTHGVAYIRGVVRPVPGGEVTDIKAALNIVARSLREKGLVRDFVIDCAFR